MTTDPNFPKIKRRIVRRRAEKCIETWKERNRLDGFESLYSYEIEEVPFDSAV